eukprot:CAMPEP_0203853902 /NCGR_PEP_ID=MMETSP0359-20131031/8803_1 /ASSEMBLY_ACC=CAM_ASM_000338 /TAXON_ID=268821 /ORGANISM="Scrippsiella Hangoei, Strain SHTV-5" /LENGTH=420 /DNA_ID=CAMNT_0050770329 /DNA_START=115 /DNA_END=1377 /DNA_ORIENTATION=-
MKWREEQEGEVSPNSFTAFRPWEQPTAAPSSAFLAVGGSSFGSPSGIGSSSQDAKANHELEGEEDGPDSFAPLVENISFAGMAGRGLRKARKNLEECLAEMTTREEAVGRCGFSTPVPEATPEAAPEAAPAPGQRAPRPKSAPLRSRLEGLAARSTAPLEGGGNAAAPSLRGALGPAVLAWAADVPALDTGVGATFEDHLQSRSSPSTRASSPSAVAPELVPLSTSGFAVPSIGEMSRVITKKAKTTRSVPTTIPEDDQEEEEAMAGVAGPSLRVRSVQLEPGQFSTEPPSRTSSLMSSTRILAPVPPRGPNTRPRRYRASSAADAGSPASAGASSGEPSSGAASGNFAGAAAAGLSVVVEDEQVTLRRYRASSAADAGSPASSGPSSGELSSGAASGNFAGAAAAGLSVVVEDEQVTLR